MAPSSTDRRSDARMVQEVVSTRQPAEASAMQRNHSVGGSHSAKRVLPLVGLDEYEEPRHGSVRRTPQLHFARCHHPRHPTRLSTSVLLSAGSPRLCYDEGAHAHRGTTTEREAMGWTV